MRTKPIAWENPLCSLHDTNVESKGDKHYRVRAVLTGLCCAKPTSLLVVLLGTSDPGKSSQRSET